MILGHEVICLVFKNNIFLVGQGCAEGCAEYCENWKRQIVKGQRCQSSYLVQSPPIFWGFGPQQWNTVWFWSYSTGQHYKSVWQWSFGEIRATAGVYIKILKSTTLLHVSFIVRNGRYGKNSSSFFQILNLIVSFLSY